MKRDIDQIREKIGIHDLDTDERKRLLKLFTEHGGEISEPHLDKQFNGTSHRQQPLVRNKEVNKHDKVKSAKNKTVNKEHPYSVVAKNTKGNVKKSTFVDRIKIQLRS